MSKVLGYTNNGGEDWFVSSNYGNIEIQGISDPEGGHTLDAPTSIPSPFARMDLVRKAFENIVSDPSLSFSQQGNKILVSKEDERLVSQCFDLAEILFFYNNYKDSIEIIEWEKSTQLNKLKSSAEPGHKMLGEALELYLQQDEATFNFNRMKNIYIIKYNHQVIGGTSPLTLFFPTANDISGFGLKSNKGKTFFKDVVPLYERDDDFQKYIYLLFDIDEKKGSDGPEINLLASNMKELVAYLDKNLKFLKVINKNALYDDLNRLNKSDLNNNYIDLNSNNASHTVEVLGVPLKTIDPEVVINSIKKSDFVIFSSKTTNEKKPLVLAQGANNSLMYVNSIWDSNTRVPYFNPETNLDLRKLPGHDIIYPYLTVSDFLEPGIIRLVYPINNEKYFNGNLVLKNPESTKGYLLPLKPLFFEYFDVEELVNGGMGKPVISIQETSIASAVRVLLKIPINNGRAYITFERTYHNDKNVDLATNKGIINEHQFGVTLFPFIKYEDSTTPFYKIQLIDRDVTGDFIDAEYNLKFYSNTSKTALNVDNECLRSKKQKGEVTKITSKSFSVNSTFDYIQVDNKFSKGIIIPKWYPFSNAGDSFTFAVDFGTTNSHIEFSKNNSAPRPFEITEAEIQAVPLFSNKTDHNFSGSAAIDIRTAIIKEFIPDTIGKNTPYSFPHRTAISQSKTHAPSNGGIVLNEFNIPFIFEKTIDNNNNFFTNLKWNSKEPNNESRVTAFIEQILFMIRNKVIISGGNLETTKIIWTYPTSMSPARKSHFKSTWDKLFKKYINTHDEPVDVSESVAPYYYFLGNSMLEGLGNGVSVLMDIGGGTSDVVVYESNIPKLLSSYKFAGNTIFGDGYKDFGDIQNNQLVNRYKEDYTDLLNEHNKNLSSIANDIYSRQKSSDYNALLFSLSGNYEIKQKELFDYNKKLSSDQDLKIIFLYFYSAKIYHMAQLMKVNQVELPMNIIFSGNGSKIISIITSDKNLISDLTKNIFSKVYGITSYPSSGLKINLEKEFPKEVTCKGALMYQKLGKQNINVADLKRTLTCVEDIGIFKLTNGQIDDTVQDKVVAQVKDFNKLFIELNNSLNFEDYFDISQASFAKFKEIADLHLKAFLKAGIAFNNRMDGVSTEADVPISETLFFYPIVETIQQLINEIAVLRS
ncbi:hypothetical protein HDE68_001181 [Pedobacter cryoconitis]|uniref:Ppx/GppA phosphatase domain-containing protein n=1 Tax=Pedobacter cryoconitis TaxID=188932 RepID=A0A7W8ZJP7_9SPHI|nr:cell division protein FtsA [Pedobacter cryoconitis]MBB5635296.1 hypothetical protein [Pedobacter cryoconitis]